MVKTDIRRKFAPGASIFEEGAPGDCAYIVEQGEVEISIQRGGETVRLARRGPGEIFGEMAIVDEAPRSAAATALTECRLLVLTREQLQGRLRRMDPVLNMVFGVVLERFRDSIRSMRGEATGVAAPAGEAGAAETTPFIRSAIDRIELEQELRSGIAAGHIEFHYQPLTCARRRVLLGYEALARWRRPGYGLVNPADFIPVAEETGLISDISRLAVAAACASAARLRSDAETAAAYVSANVTAEDICDPSFFEHVEASLKAAGLAPDGLVLEITESTLIDNAEEALAMMARYHTLGVCISIDDFGAGYSNMGYLARYPVQWVKIDKGVVDQIAEVSEADSVDLRGLKLVKAIATMARSLELKVVAEGVETAEQADLLHELGCHALQGYYYGRPAPLFDEAGSNRR